MADLQQSVVSDVETKQEINNQIIQWEENLERLHCEQFRLRCYMASLQSGELPNPKVRLIIYKYYLNKLGQVYTKINKQVKKKKLYTFLFEDCKLPFICLCVYLCFLSMAFRVC